MPSAYKGVSGVPSVVSYRERIASPKDSHRRPKNGLWAALSQRNTSPLSQESERVGCLFIALGGVLMKSRVTTRSYCSQSCST